MQYRKHTVPLDGYSLTVEEWTYDGATDLECTAEAVIQRSKVDGRPIWTEPVFIGLYRIPTATWVETFTTAAREAIDNAIRMA